MTAMPEEEYWLLTVVREYRMVLYALEDPERDLGLNLSSPDLWGDELIDTLDRLFQRGDLIAQQRGEGPGHWLDRIGSPFVPTKHQIAEALARRLHLDYGLTAHGAARWEAAAHPRWDRYYIDSWGLDPDEGEIISGDRQILEHLLAAAPHIWVANQPIAETLVFDVLQPWQVTNWKTLPIGYRVKFETQRAEIDPQPKWDARSRIADARYRGWWSAIQDWYIHPMKHTLPWHGRVWRLGPWLIDPPTPEDRARDPEAGAHWHFTIRFNDREFSQHVFYRTGERTYRMCLFRYDTGVFLGEEVWKMEDGAFPSLEAAVSHADKLVVDSPD